MANYKSIPLSAIHIGERARPIDEEHALAIAASMAERGLINPVTLRSTPAANGGETPYTLVAGGHRLRGAELNKWAEIDAVIVKADATEAQLIELSENLYRNELTKLNRALFVVKYREIFEEKHGKIDRARNLKSSKGHDAPSMFAPGKELSKLVQERLGFGPDTYKRAVRIGQNLHPMLRNSLRGTPWEDDQKLLLKLASKSEAEQAGIAAALEFEPDLMKVLTMDKPAKPKASKQQQARNRFVTAWQTMNAETRREALSMIGISRES